MHFADTNDSYQTDGRIHNVLALIQVLAYGKEPSQSELGLRHEFHGRTPIRAHLGSRIRNSFAFERKSPRARNARRSGSFRSSGDMYSRRRQQTFFSLMSRCRSNR